MYQNWDNLLFLHWPIPADILRPMIPKSLDIDTYEGAAWIGITPFSMSKIRPAFLPPIPGVSKFDEINVRTYVHYQGIPGIWFLSLDANNLLAVYGARMSFLLPYYRSHINIKQEKQNFYYSANRIHSGASSAEFRATWEVRDKLPKPKQDSLEFFLIERYCLYTTKGISLYRARIFHLPWTICNVNLKSLSSTMIQSHGLAAAEGDPLIHGQGRSLHVEIWPLEKISNDA